MHAWLLLRACGCIFDVEENVCDILAANVCNILATNVCNILAANNCWGGVFVP